ncbi:hypothetical protein N8H75_19275 [Extibacter muris]|uniref:hypothetical protein n=1 Tax=Extibacter muris TaxID=1796622 RepID=UPI001913DCFA|nr:hypothetical protein [Extibacter muris]MCU0081408.1 hypothetical protein [Extibacter muris]
MNEYNVVPEACAPFNEGLHDFFRNPILTGIGSKYGKPPHRRHSVGIFSVVL